MSRHMQCSRCGEEIQTAYNRPLPILCKKCGGEMKDIRVSSPPEVQYDLMEWIVFVGSQRH